MTLIRKFASPVSDTVQVWPQVSVAPPSVVVCSEVVSTLSVLAAVQDEPAFQESSHAHAVDTGRSTQPPVDSQLDASNGAVGGYGNAVAVVEVIVAVVLLVVGFARAVGKGKFGIASKPSPPRVRRCLWPRSWRPATRCPQPYRWRRKPRC